MVFGIGLLLVLKLKFSMSMVYRMEMDDNVRMNMRYIVKILKKKNLMINCI